MTTQPVATTTKTESEPAINMGALSMAMAEVDAKIETFVSPLSSNAHIDQADYHRNEISKLRRDSDLVIAGRTQISNSIAAARSDLRRLFESADSILKDRERDNANAKASELADIKKSMSAHSASLQVLVPGSADNVETFRAAGSAKVS